MERIYGRFLKSISLNLVLAIIFFVSTITNANAFGLPPLKSDSVTIQGRWDITIDVDGKMLPSWLEIRHSGLHMLVGEFVGTGGSARPISRINFVERKMSFSIPPQWDREESDLSVEGTLKDEDSLAGMLTLPNGKTYNWTAKRAPLLNRSSAPFGESPFIFLTVLIWMPGTLQVRINGWQNQVS